MLSLNDLTPSPISRPGTHCLQWQWANACANLWWRHQSFPGETSIALRPCAGKAGVAKRYWWCLGIIPSNRCCQFRMISQILEEMHLYVAGRVWTWHYSVFQTLAFTLHIRNQWLVSVLNNKIQGTHENLYLHKQIKTYKHIKGW